MIKIITLFLVFQLGKHWYISGLANKPQEYFMDTEGWYRKISLSSLMVLVIGISLVCLHIDRLIWVWDCLVWLFKVYIMVRD